MGCCGLGDSPPSNLYINIYRHLHVYSMSYVTQLQTRASIQHYCLGRIFAA